MDVNKLNQDRLTDKDFCDFTIKTKTREFPIHKCVFGVTSPFFKRIFLTNMKEKYESCVIIETISTETMETVIEFLYNQRPLIDSKNVFEIVEAADYLQIPDLVKLCQEILEDNLCEETVLKIWKLANKLIIEDLLEKSSKIIKENFVSICKQNEFFESEFNVVEEILKLRNESISEEEFYQCIEDWVRFDIENRQIHFAKLFLLIDLENISSEFLSENISNNSLVLENIESSKHLIKFMDQKIMKCITAIEEEKTKRSDDSQKPVSFKELEFVAVGGTLSPKSVRKYNVVMKQWRESFLDIENIFAGLILLDCELFVLGGRCSNSENSYSNVHCYNLLDGSLKEYSPMLQKRHKFGCAVLNSKIYVAGGMAHKTERLSSFEYYTPWLNKWNGGPDMNYKRAGCCLVHLNGWLYALGGTNNRWNSLKSVEASFIGLGVGLRFSWEIKPSMNYPRTEFAAVVLCGKIYAIGGRDGQRNLSSVEKYDRESDSWSYVASLNFIRAGHSACVIEKKIYVVGGESNGHPVTQIEVYDPELDEWKICDGDTGNLIGATITFL